MKHSKKRKPLGNYEVGYLKPPVWSRFAKGQSGNPSGLRKNETPKSKAGPDLEKALRDQILKEGHRPIAVRDGPTSSETESIKAALRAELIAAIKGNPIAQRNAIQRYCDAARAYAIEIEEDHAKWRIYRDNYEQMAKRGEPLPDNLPHPDDLIFEEGKKVPIAWTPKSAANTRQWIEALLLQAEKDRRARGIKLTDADGANSLSFFFAHQLNDWLFPRYRIDDTRFILFMERCSGLKKTDLEHELKTAWTSLGLAYSKDTVLPPATPHIKQLHKYLAVAVDYLKSNAS